MTTMQPVDLAANAYPPDVKKLLLEIQNTQDMVADVRGEQVTPADMAKAVASGIKAAVSDPEMWAAATKALQEKAQAEAGGWLLGGLKAAASKVAWVVTIALGVYLVGGWSALAAFFKSSAHS